MISVHMPTWRKHARGMMHDDVKGDDLLSETLLKLFENQNERLEEIAMNGNLFAYVNRAIFLMATDSTSRFHVKYRFNEIHFDDQKIKFENESDPTWIGSRIENEYLDAYISLMPEIEAIMLRLYMMDGFSYKVLSKETGIPIRDLYKIVETAINKIRRNVKTRRSSTN